MGFYIKSFQNKIHVKVIRKSSVTRYKIEICNIKRQRKLQKGRLFWSKRESDITSRWVHREFNLMFTLNSDRNERKNLLSRSLSLSVNEPLLTTWTGRKSAQL